MYVYVLAICVNMLKRIHICMKDVDSIGVYILVPILLTLSRSLIRRYL